MTNWPKRKLLSYFFSACLFALIASIVLLAWVPPISRDALTHHLLIPKLYIANGGIYEIPEIPFSYYPMNINLLYVIPLYLGSDIMPKFIHFGFALLTGIIIFLYLKKRLDIVFALLGFLLFLSVPVIVRLSTSAYVDLGLIFFSTASIYYILLWAEKEYQLIWLVLAGIFCGLALGTKYNALPIFILLLFLVPIVSARRGGSQAHQSTETSPAGIGRYHSAFTAGLLRTFRPTVIFFLTAFFVFSPWLIKNTIWTGNPFFPLFNQWFNPNTAVTSEISISADYLVQRAIFYGESWWQIALVPVRIFFQGQDNSHELFDGQLSPILLILPVFAFIRKRKDTSIIRTEKVALLLFSVLMILFVFFTAAMRIRYIAPAIPALVILSIYGFHNLISYAGGSKLIKIGTWVSVISTLVLITAFWLNAAYIFKQFKVIKPFSFISGNLERGEYIQKFRPEYTVFLYANTHIAADSKIMALFLGHRFYYSDRTIFTGEKRLRGIVGRSESGEHILNELRKDGVTHILVRFDILNEWIESQFSTKKKQYLQNFFKYQSHELISKRGYGLFELKPVANRNSKY